MNIRLLERSSNITCNCYAGSKQKSIYSRIFSFVGQSVDLVMLRYLSMLFFVGLVFWGCKQSAIIESEKAINLLHNNEYYFLDVRTNREHIVKSIPDTECIPVQEIQKRIEELKKYKSKKIIVYCRSGNRSRTATEILNENGYNAFNLIGGMNGWKGEIETGK